MESSFLRLENDKSTKRPVNRIWRERRKDATILALTGLKEENNPITLNTA